METKSYDFNWIRFLSNQVPVKGANWNSERRLGIQRLGAFGNG